MVRPLDVSALFNRCALALSFGPLLGRLAWAQSGLVQGLPPSTPAEPVASDASVAALLFDLERIVRAEESSGWLIDAAAERRIHPDVMESVCRVVPSVRALALERVEAEGHALGDPRALYREAGDQLTTSVEVVISASRRLAALRHAVEVAPEECPFWLSPEPEFRGVQGTRDRGILNFDTGGTVQLRSTEGSLTLGAGGFGRLLAGYSFTHVSVLAGVELGGGAMLEPNTDPTEFVINYLPALPLIVRLHHQAWNFDLEAASVALFQAGNSELSYGVRGGLTVGISSLRIRGILPWVGLGIATEYHFESLARPEALYLRSGFRVGGVWDP